MTRRQITLALLFLVPVLVYLGLGAYALWETGLFQWTWWILPGCWLVTWGVAQVWRPAPKRSSTAEVDAAPHWTPRDEQAAEIIQEFQNRVDELAPDQLTDPHFYLSTAQDLARQLAGHYHPRASDPVSSLTVPEVLAAIRLAVDDIERWFVDSVPGSHLVTIRQWKMLGHAPKWLQRAKSATWAASVLINPANLARYFTSKMTLDPVVSELKTEFLAAVYLRFVRQVGFYLIEMNSGRLQGGADRYQTTFQQQAAEHSMSRPGVLSPLQRKTARDESTQLIPQSLCVAVVGQVKAGKSSLINALIGDHSAETDVLPKTSSVQRFQLILPDSDVGLTLLDTPGYADAGATKSQMKEMATALQQADAALLVLDAHSPARAADEKLLHDLQRWYADHPHFKPPPMIACLTHIDLLSPAMEWSPPYNWREPDSPKATAIAGAVRYAEELFGESCSAVIPICSDGARDRVSGISEELLPALLNVLGEAQSAALLKAYHRQLSRERFHALLHQLKKTGTNLLNMWIEERLLPAWRSDSEPESPGKV